MKTMWVAHQLRPARETCERCHFPEKFSDDSLREIKQFLPDADNTPTSIYLTFKTGGGTKREGLGRGIHWHIENEVKYLALDREEQEIPYIQVVNDDGSIIVTSSLAAVMGVPGNSQYSGTKAAINSFCQIAALELGPRGIRVNSVCPGFIHTKMGASNLGSYMSSKVTALGRIGEV